MTEDEKMQVAVFRFGVISDFVTGGQMGRTEKSRLIRENAPENGRFRFQKKPGSAGERFCDGFVFTQPATMT